MTLSGKDAAPIARIEPFDPGPSADAAVAVLSALGSPYALIGGLALDAWGIARATRDLDLAVPEGIAEQAAAQLAGEREPLRIGGMGVRSPTTRIDLIDRRFHFKKLFAEAIEEARASGRTVAIGSVALPLVSREHLLAMKMVSGEPKDEVDARRLLDLEGLDYLRARALVEQHLGPATANRLDTMAREASRSDAPKRYR